MNDGCCWVTIPTLTQSAAFFNFTCQPLGLRRILIGNHQPRPRFFFTGGLMFFSDDVSQLLFLFRWLVVNPLPTLPPVFCALWPISSTPSTVGPAVHMPAPLAPFARLLPHFLRSVGPPFCQSEMLPRNCFFPFSTIFFLLGISRCFFLVRMGGLTGVFFFPLGTWSSCVQCFFSSVV